MKVKKSEIQLLIAVIGVLIAVCTYFLVYTKFNDLSEGLEAQNTTLASQVATLEILDQRKTDYLDATEKMQAYIIGFENRYPANILPEDSIMMVKNMEGRRSPTFLLAVLQKWLTTPRQLRTIPHWRQPQRMLRQIPQRRQRMQQCPEPIRRQLPPTARSLPTERCMRIPTCMKCLWESALPVPMTISRGW